MNPSDRNPYRPPQADVTPVAEEFDQGELIDGGQSVPAGNGITWIGEGFKLFGRAPLIWIVNMILLFVMAAVMGFIPIIGSIASSLLMPIFFGGLLLGCRVLDAGGEFKVEHLFSGFKENAGQLALMGLLMLVFSVIVFIVLVIVAVVYFGSTIMQFINDKSAFEAWFLHQGLLAILLFVLACFAAFVPLSMAYWFAPALIVFHKIDALTAMRKSFQGCMRNMLPFLLYGIVLFVLGIISIIPFGLGLLVFFPMIYASAYASYKDIYTTGSQS